MTPSDLTSFISTCQHLFAILAFPINAFLIFLIITKSPPKLGAYKYLMIFISVFEMAYSGLDLLLKPLNFNFGPTFSIVIPTKGALFSRDVLFILNVIYWGFFGSSLAVFCVHFVYRYLAVNGSEFLKRINSWRIVFLFVPTFLSAFTWSLISYFACRPSEVKTEFIRKSVFESFGLENDEFDYLGLYIYEVSPKDSSISFRSVDLVGVTLVSCIMSSSMFIVMFFGWKCYRSLSSLVNRSMSSKTYSKVQSQLFYALVIQTIIPFVFLIAPSSFCSMCAVFNINCSYLNGIVSITIAFYPVIDPLPTIFIVKNYRNALFNIFKRFGCFQNRVYFISTSSNANELTQTMTARNVNFLQRG